MASSVIHLAIAKKLKKCLNVKNSYDYYLGAIAPDLAKQISRTKNYRIFSLILEKMFQIWINLQKNTSIFIRMILN